MPRRSVLKVVKVNHTPSAPWMVRVPTRLQPTEGSRKKFFDKEAVAKAYGERLARQMGDYHTQALGLSDRQKLEAAECYRIIGKEDASLLEAVHHYVAYLAGQAVGAGRPTVGNVPGSEAPRRSEHQVPGGFGSSRRRFRDAYKAAGIEHWKTDLLRHSFGTFRLPILKSADALALEMGNSPAVIFRHYRRPMTEVDAQKYFDLLPAG